MRAIVISAIGGPDVLGERELPDPEPRSGEVLIAVAAAGVNRADMVQRQGYYPPPPGAPDWPGLEVSGTIVRLGSGVAGWKVGDRVCALLAGGGYASLAVASAHQLLSVPESVNLVDAAALPEALATVWSNVFLLGGLRAGETLLIHGGSSGIGTMAIQLARAFGCRVAVTAGSAAKLAACEQLGADILIDYTTEDFVDSIERATDGAGADVILDPIGGAYLDRNVRALARHGRIMLIGNQSGVPAEFAIGRLMARWGSIHATSLRARPEAEKDEIIASVRENVWPLVAARQVVPIVDRRFSLADARLAHERLESSAHIGKLLLLP
ncbi:putative PIG3 family NAD(P)H quinone oxidoreductase [Marisediminicola sp. UYEF4]|uniref:NAD(P)H-quinone oxidoreductase n=1 Tax=Marisediminicola sp. UYEF4 TaxID=1756384 RepID=UPI003391F931